MKKRQKHERIINHFGTPSRCLDVLVRMLAEQGLSILNDDAAREMAQRLVDDYRFTQKLNKQNREMFARRRRSEAA